METGNNIWPPHWVFFPQTESSPEDSVVLLGYGSDGAMLLLINATTKRPLGPSLPISFDEVSQWEAHAKGAFAEWHQFGQEAFAAWFPKDWTQEPAVLAKPLDPTGDAWESYSIEKGMRLLYRMPKHCPEGAIPMMAINAQRWLSPLAKRDAVRVHRMGNRLELAAIQKGRLIVHNLFTPQTAQDAAYSCMLLYDQCSLSATHIPLIWEGDADESCWEILRPFIQTLDSTASHPWSALTVLYPSH